jgi:hypothetical protein
MAIKVPPGQSPPFETVDSDHHAGIIIIVSAICLVLSLVCLLIRVYVRFFLSPPFGIDDVILLGATVSTTHPRTFASVELLLYNMPRPPSLFHIYLRSQRWWSR